MPSKRLRTVLGLTFLGQLGLLLWSRSLSWWMLALTAGLLAGGALLERRRSAREVALTSIPLAQAALLLALVLASATSLRLEWGLRDWSSVAASRETHLAARLEDRLQGVALRARTAAEQAAAVEGPAFEALDSIRRRTGVDAVALLADSAAVTAWSGEHRGRIPPTVMAGDDAVAYPGGTLFGYLYAVVPGEGGRSGVAAVLLDVGPPLRGATAAVVERFEEVTGERPRLSGPDAADADWRLVVDGQVVLSAQFPELSPGDWRVRVARTGRRAVFVLVLAGLALLSVAWLRSVPERGGLAAVLPMAGLSVTLMATPLRRTLGLDRLFSPGWFVLPVPGDFVIEGVMVVLLPVAAFLSTLRPQAVSKRELWLRLVIGAALAGGGFAVGAGIMAGSAGAPMLTSSGPLWYVLQTTTVVLLTSLAVLLLPRSDEEDGRRAPILYGVTGVAVSIMLALGVTGTWTPDRTLPTPALIAWSVPFLLLGRAVAGFHGRGDRLVRWLAAGWLAATAVVPHLWIVSQRAHLTEAEAEVVAFDARGDPFLNYLLDRFAEAIGSETRSRAGVDLLYEAWVASGLASEPYPLEVSLWDRDLRRLAHLPLGVRVEDDGMAQRELARVVEEARRGDSVVNAPARGGGVSRILAVPLQEGRTATVAVAPRASLEPTSALTTFMEGGAHQRVTLDLLPVSTITRPIPGPIRWQRSEEGWRSEAILQEGSDLYHAHLALLLPSMGVRLARAALLITLDLLLLSALWMLGRTARGDPPVPPGGWLGWLGGFRARLTVALFAFFLLPTAVFGWAAYHALADEVARAARQVAERAVAHAAETLPQAGLTETARRTGEDLLYYRRGVLTAASTPEAAELGLYNAWIPSSLYRQLRSSEAVGGTERGELGGRSYLVAYRRLRSAEQALGVPVWLAGRDVALRQRELAHMVVFGVLVGGVLSLALSVLVGRALAQPIGELRRAAAAVGRGHLRVRLPQERADEFGELFASFNRMARRLRRARAQEIRTARILAWGEMARQVAHEIKNPLTPIKLSIQHIRRAYRDRRSEFDDILESNVEQILKEIERLTEIARAFSRYGAPQESAGAMQAVDVATVVREVLTLYRAPDREVTYHLRLDDPSPVVAARSSELREVLINLLENARVAVGDEGRVEVVVKPAGPRVLLEVRDDGEGIPPDQVGRIFEPHFSTRSSGTGLGLAIVRRLVEGWAGDVSAESEAGVGTVVRVIIPRTEAAPTSGEAGAGPGPGEGGVG